jgi:hypothetical protein
MAAEAKCANCKHRGARNICAEAHSQHHGRQVEPTDTCQYFLENPAEEHLANGLVAALADDRVTEEIHELEQAIALGLPADSEMHAHYFLGVAYGKAASRKGLPVEQMVRTPEFAKAMGEQETAVRMDRDGAYGYFKDPLGRGLLQSLDNLFALASRRVASEQGPQAAAAFLEDKMRLGDGLTTSPFLGSLLELGNLYAEGGAKDRAALCFQRVVHAEPVDRSDESGMEAEVRSMAARNYHVVAGTNRTGAPGCILLVAVIGLALVTMATMLTL